MKKKLINGISYDREMVHKIWMTMRLIVFLFFVSLIHVSASVYSQKTRLKIKAENSTLLEVFKAIQTQSEFDFFYKNEQIPSDTRVTIDYENESIEVILDNILKGTGLNYHVLDKDIVISSKGTANNDITQQQQQKTVTGKVTDQSGASLPGVSVVVKGTTSGVITDTNGNFSLLLPPDAKSIAFSFVGMKTQEIVIGNQTTFNVLLQSETIGLDEVVAVGYGTQKRRDITGSVSNVDTKKIEDISVGQVTQKLQGQIAGVQLNQSTGVPWEEMAIRIRGAASINAGNNPLYVIDGFPIDGGLRDINPNEIESISVLKGSSASSLYGSRAANGVILITTKKAKSGQNIIKLSIANGISKIPQRGRYKMMNAKEFLEDRKALWEDKILYEGWTGGIPEIYQNPDAWKGPDTNWYDELLQTGEQQSYNLTFLSNKGKFSSATNVGYFNEMGVVKKTGYKRYSLRSNNDYEVNENIKVGFNIAPTYSKFNGLATTDGYYNLVYCAIITPPIFSPNDKNPDGSTKLSFTGPGLFTFPNWRKTIEDQITTAENLRLLSNAYGELRFLKYFNFKTSFSTDLSVLTSRSFFPSTVGYIFTPPPQVAKGSYATQNRKSWLFENTLNFDKTFGISHNVNALLGYSSQEYKYEDCSLSGNGFPDDQVNWLGAASNITSWSNSPTDWSLISMFGRLNYNFKEKYFVSGSLRRDGSSRFGSNSRWGVFPSVSAGWIISDENFAKKIPLLSFLKLRSEYGVTGNFNVGNYTQFGNVSSSNYVFGSTLVSGRSQSTIENSKLTWETTSGVDIGVDATFCDNRIGFTFDYYDKNTNNMLYQIDVPWGSGYSNIQSNIGKFHFWGSEFTLSSKNLVRNLKWNSDFNISFNRNKVIKLGTNNVPIGGIYEMAANVSNITAVGHPIGQLYGYVSDGIYMTQEEFDTQPKHYTSRVGTARFKDLNNDKIIDSNDRTYLGNPSPKFNFGLTNSFSYKQFDLNVIVSGAYGGKLMKGLREWTETLEGIFNVEKYMKDRWRSPENPGSGIIGRTLSGTTAFARVVQSRWIEDASYLTIKNISLGYSLTKLKYINKARIYLSIQQAFVFTNYSGPNPEATVYGLNGLNEGNDGSSYPVPRRFSIGIDLNF